jgi:hypothetical protein
LTGAGSIPSLRRMAQNSDISKTLGRDAAGYAVALSGLSREEAVEVMATVRRLELYRSASVDVDIVESASRSMAKFDISNATKAAVKK